mgnify:CR=1 FL=1
MIVNGLAKYAHEMARFLYILAISFPASSLFVLASTASVFSASIKDTILEYLPNLFLIDAVGSSETGATGVNIHTKDGKLKDSGGGPKFTKPNFSEILKELSLRI